jgi:hypothetical protein
VINNNDPQEIYKRWARIEKRINSGEQVSEPDRSGLERYQKTPGYENMKSFFEDFGLPIEEAQA